MERRTLLKTVGSIGAITTAGGIGAYLTSTSATAASTGITANPATVQNDRGDVTEVTIDPDFWVMWQNFDDAVGKVFWLVEARVAGGDWKPLYRATPWLDEATMGTTGELDLYKFSSRLGRKLVVAGPEGVPDYSSLPFPGGVDLASYLDGTSMSSADTYPGSSGVVLQNNFGSENAGYYGAAAATKPYPQSPFDEQADGTQSDTTVELRYTIELQRPNLSQLEYLIGTTPSGYGSMTDAEKKTAMAAEFEPLLAPDIDAGNSRVVMEGEDGYPAFDGYADGAGIPYDVLRDNADSHPGIILEETQFDVTAVNELSSSDMSNNNQGSSGDSNTGAS